MKNRNRKDMLVDFHSESAVISQLERIHKGEKVVEIHELIWDEKQIEEVVRINKLDENPSYYGTVKFFDAEKGFGFIEPETEMDDLFFHATACTDGLPRDKDKVEFKVNEGPKGLSAIHVRIIN